MAWIFRESVERILLSPSPQSPPPQSNLYSSGFNLNNKVSPSILLIIIILAVIFFISGVLHLFVRFLIRKSNRNPDELENSTAIQGQLQQLFDLHDAGVDQSFIDTLPVFNYKSIIGVKNPFDCSVCLCEFENDDNLRLLPKCSHAFHMECIDTWLLSHSSCPLCRANLTPDYSTSSPIVLVLESASDTSREIQQEIDTSSIITRQNSQLGFRNDEEIRIFSNRFEVQEEENQEKVAAVKLGKFKNVNGGEFEGECSSESNHFDGRRCFSMGSFEYVMDDNSLLKVPIRAQMIKKQSSKNGHKPAKSECGGDSKREFTDFTPNISFCASGDGGGRVIGKSKRESFSISKIWLRGKSEMNNLVVEGSRRAFSFRFPVKRSMVGQAEELKPKNGGGDIEIGNMRRNGVSEFGFEQENIHRSISLNSQENAHSFARRTLLWFKGKQNKVVHSSFPNNL